MSGEEHTEQTPEVETKARALGWVPKDEFRGDETRWVDADTYIQRGETMLPLIRKQNQELRSELDGYRQRDLQRDAELKSVKAALKVLETAQDEDTQQRAEDLQQELADEIEAASREGEHGKVAELTKKLVQLNVALATKPVEKKEEKEIEESPGAPELTPEYMAWEAKNPWIKSDGKRGRLVQVAAMNVKEDSPTLRGAAFFEALDLEMARLEGRTQRQRGESRVSGGERGAGESSGTGSNYSDLPADAKAACESYAKQFVGLGKRYKDANAWRTQYAKEYFKEGAGQ